MLERARAGGDAPPADVGVDNGAVKVGVAGGERGEVVVALAVDGADDQGGDHRGEESQERGDLAEDCAAAVCVGASAASKSARTIRAYRPVRRPARCRESEIGLEQTLRRTSRKDQTAMRPHVLESM
jgi:hypothetical protein